MQKIDEYLALCFYVYQDNYMVGITESNISHLNSVAQQYLPTIISNFTNNSGVYTKENFACSAYQDGNLLGKLMNS